ncbi:MAG: 2Fe-2S iron-sulfur cluster binding domain-containing protein [Planctomycetaceae bacterium]|nr:2Fe-2S iron-sulfur cluster binding domain-containing protein [Planctomycetaceae bacterium]
MATITVDGNDIQVGDDERLNVIQAADRAGVAIPFYCWHPGLSVVASCRMCLVETGMKNKDTGEISMMPKLVPACQTPAKDGTVVVTNSPKVRANQNFVQEGLLLDHPVDCPICDKAGECWLQDYYFSYGHQERRADVRPFTSRKRDLGEHVTLFVDRCVMCSRCVRFTQEVSGGSELLVIDRGSHAEIDVFPGFPLDDQMSGNVNDLCPVGALCSKDFLYQQRVWFMEPHDSVCTRCSTGCSIQLHVSQNQLYRIQPRYNPNANDWWMCDIGRFENESVRAPERLSSIEHRSADSKTGAGFSNRLWPEGLKAVHGALSEIAARTGGSTLAVVLSPFLTCEEAYLLATYAKTISADVVLALGKVPVEGADKTFKSGFTIRAERCPNRLGVEQILRHFQKSVIDWPALLKKVEAGELQGAYVSAGYPVAWIDEAEAAAFERLSLLVVHDILPSPLARKAHYVVPGVSFAEKDGSYVNHSGLIQWGEWGLTPVEGAHVDGQTFSDLLGRKGLYQAASVLKELAGIVPFFARAADGVPQAGLNLVTGTEKHPRTTALGTVTHPLPTFRSVGTAFLETEAVSRNGSNPISG